MPRIKKQKLKKRADGRFRCRYQNKDFYGRTEEEALAARNEYIYKVESGQLAHDSRTVSEYAKKWLPIANANVRKKTYNTNARLLEFLTKECGQRELSEVLPSDIKAIYSKYFIGYSDGYIRRAKQLYKSLFESAIADRLCERNPAADKTAAPHRGYKGSHRAITPQERYWIETYCHDHRAFPAVAAMLYEGLRPPEAKALNIDRDIDWNRGIVHISHFAHYDGNHYDIDEEGKTENSIRDIPLFPPFAEAVKGKHGDIISCVDGKPITLTAWKKVYQSYVSKMETAINGVSKRWYGKTQGHKSILADGDPLPPWISFTVKPYDLRHSFAAFCRDHGIELNTVVHWMGHSDATMILKIYDEVSPERDRNEAEKLKKVLLSGQGGGQNLDSSTEQLKHNDCKG